MLFEMIIVLFLGMMLFKLGQAVFGVINEKKNDTRYRQYLAQALPNHLVYAGKKLSFTDIEIFDILEKYSSYFKHLDAELQKKFAKRVKKFIKAKIFIIRHSEGFKEMPVLISGAAVQITFGLKKYLLPHFTYIQIHPEEYFAEHSFRVLAGHVHGNMITLAWNHFLKGFQYLDGQNVGLHEMAHALYYQHIIADSFKPEDFVENFKEVLREGEETSIICKEEEGRLYSDYAFINMQEFWAESLEIFFEKPMEMEQLYPGLYHDLCKLLGQNPKNASFPLKKLA